MRNVVLGVTLLLVALLSGCEGSRTQPDGTFGSSSSTEPTVAYPRGADQLVLRVTVSGGLLPPDARFTELPTISLMGDRRLVAPGPVPAIYPGPAMTPLGERRLTERGVQRVLQAAQQAGLTQRLGDLGSPPVADAPTTKITLVTDGETVANSVYALGISDSEPGTGLTPTQLQARQRVTTFLARLGDTGAWLGTDAGPSKPYTFPALAVQITEAGSGETDPSGVVPNMLAWPLGDLGTLGSRSPVGSLPQPPAGARQALVAGDDLERLRSLLNQATAITVWTSSGRRYHLTFRPLLPDEVPAR